MTKHSLLGGKVHVYKRDNSLLWQCSTYLQGKNRRVSTKTESLAEAKGLAEDGYVTLIDQHRSGEVIGERTFRKAAKQFEQEYEVVSQRSKALPTDLSRFAASLCDRDNLLYRLRCYSKYS